MKVSEMRVEPASRKEIEPFIAEWNYSGGINGCNVQYGFKLMHGEQMIGASFFGWMAMAGQWKRFGEKETDVIELRRLCCIDSTPKNTESFFIGGMLRWLEKNTDLKTVVSYADAEYGHSGVIYKASNFKYMGFSKGAKVVVWNGKKYHDKSLRTKYKGELKPFSVRLRQALESGEAAMAETAGKHTYVYELKRKRRPEKRPQFELTAC